MGVEETQGSGVEAQEAYRIVRREVRVRLATAPPRYLDYIVRNSAAGGDNAMAALKTQKSRQYG